MMKKPNAKFVNAMDVRPRQPLSPRGASRALIP